MSAEEALAALTSRTFDLVLLDCHDYNATRGSVMALLRQSLLSRDAFVVLHDTGLHPTRVRPWLPTIPYRGGFIHGIPAERIFADWLRISGDPEGNWQRVSAHDNKREPMRHGLTIMQRRVDLRVPWRECSRLTGGDTAVCSRDA